LESVIISDHILMFIMLLVPVALRVPVLKEG